jgi:hypothetical protein
MSETPNEDSQLDESRNEADTILFAAASATKSPSWRQLRGEEQVAIAEARDRLTLVKQGDDTLSIREAIHALDRSTRRLAESMIEAAVQITIRGEN